MKLDDINKEFVRKTIKYFLDKCFYGEVKTLDQVISNVKSNCKLDNIKYIFDESIWTPDKPLHYKNKIRFIYKLGNCDIIYDTYVKKVKCKEFFSDTVKINMIYDIDDISELGYLINGQTYPHKYFDLICSKYDRYNTDLYKINVNDKHHYNFKFSLENDLKHTDSITIKEILKIFEKSLLEKTENESDVKSVCNHAYFNDFRINRNEYLL